MDAVTSALTSPLLGTVDVAQATGALVHVIGDPTMTVSEAERVAALVAAKISHGARIIWGCSIDGHPPAGGDPSLRVLLVVTGVRGTGLFGEPSPSGASLPTADAVPAGVPAPSPSDNHEPPPPLFYRIRHTWFRSARKRFRRGRASGSATDSS